MAEHAAAVAHQFDDAEQQRGAAELGMWIFLATEVMFFGGMFTAFTAYRWLYPAAFAHASRHLDVLLGGTNTVVLIGSSLTMVLGCTARAWGNAGRCSSAWRSPYASARSSSASRQSSGGTSGRTGWCPASASR